MLKRQQKRIRRHKRIRAKIKGTAIIPRLCVFKSGKHIYAQLIDDEKNIIIASVKDQELKKSLRAKEEKNTRKVAIAFVVGKLIAEKALEKKIDKIVFDRGGYKYHGRIKSLAEGAREGGLKF
jgi:large subunit ribosomal protein L18